MKIEKSSINKSVNVIVHEIPAKSMAERKKLLLYALGIFVCYFYFGILQEKITRSKYGESKEVYTCTASLVLIQCVVNAAFARLLLSTLLDQPHDTTKHIHYILSAFTYLVAMVTSNMALIHVNYPTQVVGKSCKPIPVMILGVLLGRKSYPLAKYLFVFVIVLGVGLFMYKEKATAGSGSSKLLGMGEILLLISLTMDGLTGAVQERMKAEHQTKSGHMMLNMNLWSVLFSGIVVLVTGEIWTFIDFLSRYPTVIYYITGFTLLSALGQMFIFLTVSEFGPLPCSIATTTRKFFTVLASVVFFGNSLSSRQWLGATLVFTGLTLDSIFGKTSIKAKA